MKIRINRHHCPVCTYLKGCIDGRIVKCAGLNDQGVIESAYVAAWLACYDEWVDEQINLLESALKGLRQETADLLADEAVVRRKLVRLYAEDVTPEAEAVTIADKRKARNQAITEAELLIERDRIVRRLYEIHEKILSRQISARQDLDKAVANLRARLCTYANGVLRKQVTEAMLPHVGSLKDPFALYEAAHAQLDTKMLKMLEVEDDEN